MIDRAILANDERHDSRTPVFSRIGQDSDAFRLGEDPIVISVEKWRLIAGAGSNGFREVAKLAERARGLTLRDRPVQPVLFARVTNELLRVLLDLAMIVRVAEVLLLRVGRGLASRDCGQLRLADPARQYLVLAGRRIEIPSAR